jgi:hypothetical protein
MPVMCAVILNLPPEQALSVMQSKKMSRAAADVFFIEKMFLMTCFKSSNKNRQTETLRSKSSRLPKTVTHRLQSEAVRYAL